MESNPKQNKSKSKKQERMLTEDIFSDYLHNESAHEIFSKRKTTEMLKSLKLIFYTQTEDEKLREKYLNYYMEVNPLFKRKYLTSNDEQKEKLLEKAIQNAKDVYEDFISHNFRLVVHVAVNERKKYKSLDLEIIDLVQEGNIGMMKAIERFDVEKDNAFSTYAIWWIRSYIKRYIVRNGHSIYVPSNMLKQFAEVHKAKEALTKKLGTTPTIEQIATYMGESFEKVAGVVHFREIFANVNSLNEPSLVDENDEVGDFIPDKSKSVEEEAGEHLLAGEIRELLNNIDLTDREKEIIIKRNALDDGESWTLEELGIEYNITKERVRQIEFKALKKLKRVLKGRKYDTYFSGQSTEAQETLSPVQIKRKLKYKQ